MRSSSKLFPVSLMAAETIGPFNEDVYELRPGRSLDPSVSLAVTRITDPRAARTGPAVILLHGEFGNRRAWLSSAGQGLAADLAEQGMDVWLAEMRGHGLSPRNRYWLNNAIADFGCFDWPAVNAFVAEQSGTRPVWVAAGLGAMGLTYGLVHHNQLQVDIAGVALINLSSVSPWRLPGSPILNMRRRRKGVIEGVRLHLGPEDEPWRLYQELRQWAALESKGEHPVFEHLREVRVPVLIVNDSQVDPRGEVGRRLLGLLGSRDRHLSRVPAHSEPREQVPVPPGGPPICPGAEAAVIEWLDQRWISRPEQTSARVSA